MKRSATVLLGAGAGFVLLAGGAAAGAAIVGPIDSSGVIHACYANATGSGQHAIVLENAGTPCPAGMTAITWNQQGPAGATGPAGPAGPAGPGGPAGATGPAGPAGADGSTILSGTGAPAQSVGSNGDFYLDTAADVLYGPKAGGTWPASGTSLIGTAGATGAAGPTGPAGPAGATGPAGRAGADGNTVLNGAGAPPGSLGDNGDFYIDTAADVLYGPKAGGTWLASGTSLIGTTGPAGPVGPSGPAGPAGAGGASSLDAMIGSPCDVGDPANSGTLMVNYTPHSNGTDTVAFLCSQSNPSFALNVTFSAGSGVECGTFLQPALCFGSGTVTSSDGQINCNQAIPTCTAVYKGSPTITLTETPGNIQPNASIFVGWQGCDSVSSDNTTCTVTVNAIRDVTATFQWNG